MVRAVGSDQIIDRTGDRELEILRPLAFARRKRNAIPLGGVSIDPAATGERLCAS